LIRQHLRPWLSAWLVSHGYTIGDIPSWAIHPGGPRVVREVAEALDVPLSAAAVSNEVLSSYGNMSSPTVLFVLERLQHSDAPRPCVALAFGPGLVVEAVLFT
jgi:predicted naringenin-chalcone synthase